MCNIRILVNKSNQDLDENQLEKYQIVLHLLTINGQMKVYSYG